MSQIDMHGDTSPVTKSALVLSAGAPLDGQIWVISPDKTSIQVFDSVDDVDADMGAEFESGSTIVLGKGSYRSFRAAVQCNVQGQGNYQTEVIGSTAHANAAIETFALMVESGSATELKVTNTAASGDVSVGLVLKNFSGGVNVLADGSSDTTDNVGIVAMGVVVLEKCSSQTSMCSVRELTGAALTAVVSGVYLGTFEGLDPGGTMLLASPVAAAPNIATFCSGYYFTFGEQRYVDSSFVEHSVNDLLDIVIALP